MIGRSIRLPQKLGLVLLCGLSLCLAVRVGFAEENRPANDAREMMHAAHDARAVWEDFPGFTADLVVRTNGVTHIGTIRARSDFKFEVVIDEEAKRPWVDAKLRSVISHRRPEPFSDQEFQFVQQDRPGGAGRLVAPQDGAGVFRIHEGIILEVHRKSDSSWFEISNLDFQKSVGGRLLPKVTSVVYRDPATGDVLSNRTNQFFWKRVGGFDLPERALTIEVGSAGERAVRELVFSNQRLLPPHGTVPPTEGAGGTTQGGQ